MIDSHPLKSLPSSWQTLIRPMLLISLALHGLLLLLPIPSKPKETPPKQEEKIKITQLPDTPPTAASPVSSAKLQASVTPKVAPPVRRQEAPIQPLTSRPKPPAKPINQTSPKPQKQVQATPSTEAKPQSSTSFPVYPGSQRGSLGLLKADVDKSAFHTADSLEQVDSYFQKELQARNFNLTPETQYQQTDRKIYEIAQNSGNPKYLYLLPQGKNVVILVASQLVDPNDLIKAGPSNSDEDTFDNTMSNLAGDSSPFGVVGSLSADELVQEAKTTFADPSDQSSVRQGYLLRFSTVPLSKVNTIQGVIETLKASFQEKGFSFSEQPKVGNTYVYKISRGESFTNYISIVATTSGIGVITSHDPPPPGP